jgi:hypothetical protein
MKQMIKQGSAAQSWLDPEDYQVIVAPSLKVAAELAASRGDPKLFKDLPSMLSLIHLVSSLGAIHIEETAILNPMSNKGSIREAPEAACMMVLAEGNVEKDQAGSLLNSLKLAYQQVLGANITTACDAEITKAWSAFKENRQEQFLAHLEQAAKIFVMSLDNWERTRQAAVR